MKKIYTLFLALVTSALVWSQCENYSVQLFSYTPLGGPTTAGWGIETLDEGVSIASGTATFNAMTFQYTETVCLEPGCYNLVIEANAVLQQTNFGATITFNGEIIYPTNELEYGTQVFNYNFCTGVEEPTCEACFTPMVYQGSLTINNCSSPVDTENTTFAWDFGDGSSGEGSMPSHQYEANGVYNICVVMIVTSNEGVITCIDEVCHEIVVEGLAEEGDCPTEIWSGAGDGCGVMQFEIASFVEDESVTWYPGDETGAVEGGHFFSHTYAEPGNYTVCAYYTSLICPDGVELCTEITVEACGDDCEGDIAVNYNCPDGLVYLYVTGWPESTPVTWYLNGTTTETPYNWLTLEANGGWFDVCAWSNDCPEICQEVYIQDCGGDDCQLIIEEIGGFECEYLILQAFEFPEGAVVHWSQNGEMVNEGNVTTFILEPGENQICAWYEFEGCVQEWCETYNGCEDDNCPDAIWFDEGELCGVMQFEIGSFSAGENVQWWFGDSNEQVEGGHFITHLYEEPGEYFVCAFYTSNDCPDGVELCTEIFVEECGEPCDAFLSADMVNCNHWTFNLDAEFYNTNIYWSFDDGTEGTWGGLEINHEFGPGTYEVCASWNSEECGEQQECITIVVEGCDNDCPDYIIAEQIDCNSFLFHIEGVDGGDVEWHFGDGGSENSGPSADHSYEEGGYYIVTATFSNENCEGVTLVYTVWVDCENTNDCPDEIWWGEGDLCGVIQFEIGSYVQGESVVWYPGDETGAQEGGHFWVHTYAEPGVYTVCAWYTSPLCPNGVELCTEIIVESCEGGGDCPDEIWHSENDCGHFNFEIGSFTEGESVDWYVGEFLAEENGGHFWTTAFETEGWISVCAFYTSNVCPDGVWLCTEVYSDLCGGDCTEVNFSLDSYVDEEGPTWVNWHLFNGEGVFVADGIAQYSNDDPHYDWSDCLPDGCYSLYVCTDNEFNGGAFDMIFSDAWDVVEITPIFNDECIGYNVLLSLNGDCGQGSDDCEAGFEPIFTATAGHVEFENTSTWEGEASFYWSYGNGQSSDDMGGNVWYTENGEYEVCLTIATSEGCTDTYCETIVIDDFSEECEGTEVVLQISTNYPDPGEDNWTITINYNEEELGTFPFISCFECPEYIELPLCLADGCYEIEFNSDYGINAEEILLAVFLIGQEIPIGELSIGYDDETGIFQVGVNDDCTDGVVENFDSMISVYPNPASDVLNISNATGETIQVMLTDATGRLVQTQTLSTQRSTLNLSNLAQGLYTLQIIGENTALTRKIEIAR
ncbi:MAG: PKD domain-containing protein [Flavobacteriales bacterium]|nr:PKD domain-containing protein [Flavobacteriales bacterium]